MQNELDKVMKTFDLVFIDEEQEEDFNGRFLPPIRKGNANADNKSSKTTPSSTGSSTLGRQCEKTSREKKTGRNNENY